MFNRKLPAAFAAVICVFWFSGAAAGFANETPLAEVNIGSNGIYFQPRVNYAKATLSVSCPDGSVLSRTFNAGASPYFSLADVKGQIRDGSYTYELQLAPLSSSKNRKAEDEMLPKRTMVQSGYFSVSGGSIMAMNTVEGGPARPQDVVHADDVIITGSLCVGFDCLTDGSENFSFDTIRLKENNLRIHFDDTSALAGFPANDWRITINDSASGGANYFSIDDVTGSKIPFRIVAGAPTSSLYVDSYGRIGIKTSTPVLEIHIKDSDTPSVRLEQDTSGGWTAQTWDIAGNESNFFIRDTTGGSKLPFRIQPGAPSNTLTLRADGKVGIGTWSPAFNLEIESTSDITFVADRTGGASAQMSARSDKTMFGSRTDHQLNLCTNNNPRVTISTAGYMGIADTTPSYPIEVANANGAYLNTSGNWVNPSSRALKENIASLTAEEAVDTLNGLNPVKYNFKVDKAEQCVGFISEDVPDLVAVKNKKGIVTMDVVAVLTRVVQEQQKTVEQQQKTVEQQQETITNLMKRISELEKK